jgi:hypothetical protein
MGGISLEDIVPILIGSVTSNFNPIRAGERDMPKCSRRKSWLLLELGNSATAKSSSLVSDCRKSLACLRSGHTRRG